MNVAVLGLIKIPCSYLTFCDDVMVPYGMCAGIQVSPRWVHGGDLPRSQLTLACRRPAGVSAADVVGDMSPTGRRQRRDPYNRLH